ncbi:MAG: hypothetical protein LBT02_03560 [Rickettsiales bacterium]|jgi:uncharacterized protein YuzE|nr:hypothetical protein [Rickettsiales bacterium]
MENVELGQQKIGITIEELEQQKTEITKEIKEKYGKENDKRWKETIGELPPKEQIKVTQERERRLEELIAKYRRTVLQINSHHELVKKREKSETLKIEDYMNVYKKDFNGGDIPDVSLISDNLRNENSRIGGLGRVFGENNVFKTGSNSVVYDFSDVYESKEGSDKKPLNDNCKLALKRELEKIIKLYNEFKDNPKEKEKFVKLLNVNSDICIGVPIKANGKIFLMRVAVNVKEFITDKAALIRGEKIELKENFVDNFVDRTYSKVDGYDTLKTGYFAREEVENMPDAYKKIDEFFKPMLLKGMNVGAPEKITSVIGVWQKEDEKHEAKPEIKEEAEIETRRAEKPVEPVKSPVDAPILPPKSSINDADISTTRVESAHSLEEANHMPFSEYVHSINYRLTMNLPIEANELEIIKSVKNGEFLDALQTELFVKIDENGKVIGNSIIKLELTEATKKRNAFEQHKATIYSKNVCSGIFTGDSAVKEKVEQKNVVIYDMMAATLEVTPNEGLGHRFQILRILNGIDTKIFDKPEFEELRNAYKKEEEELKKHNGGVAIFTKEGVKNKLLDEIQQNGIAATEAREYTDNLCEYGSRILELN